MKKPSKRQIKVSEMLRHSLADILLKKDFYVDALHDVSITLSEIRMSPDLRHATVFVYPLDQQDHPGFIEALNEAAPEIRHLLSKSVYLKYLPQLSFRLDQTFQHVEALEHLLMSTKDSDD